MKFSGRVEKKFRSRGLRFFQERLRIFHRGLGFFRKGLRFNSSVKIVSVMVILFLRRGSFSGRLRFFLEGFKFFWRGGDAFESVWDFFGRGWDYFRGVECVQRI